MRSQITQRDYFGLFLLIISYIGIFTYFTNLRYLDFFTTNWDFGIAQQMLWTGGHGYLLLETADLSTHFSGSFLDVHSTYIALLISPLYTLFPKPLFLFILQSSVLSLSIIPLFFIATDIIEDKKIIYLILGVYLLNFSLIGSLFYDFHWEIFLPLEYFTFYYFVSHKKYLLSGIPFVLGCGTLEVFPLLSLGVFLYFGYQYYGKNMIWPNQNLRDRNWYVLLTYFFLAMLAYGIIRILQFKVIPYLAPVSGITVSISISSTGFIPSGISFLAILESFSYWVVLYLSLMFIPFLYKRHFFLLLPWFIGATFIDPILSSGFGNQYSAISIIPLIIGFVYGVEKIMRVRKYAFYIFLTLFELPLLCLVLYFGNLSQVLLFQNTRLKVMEFLIILISFTTSTILLFYHYRQKLTNMKISKILNNPTKLRRYVLISLTILILFSLVLSPLNSENFNATPFPGYQFSYNINPEHKFACDMANMIVPNSTVVSSDNLFPLVANNVNSYALLWVPFSRSLMPNFPFNNTTLPDYVFFDTFQYSSIPIFLLNEIANKNIYGLVAKSIYQKYPGTLFLYEKGYEGITTYFNVTG